MHLFCSFPHGVCSLFSLAWELSGAPWSSLIFFPPLRTWLLKYTVTVFWIKTKPVWFGLMDIETSQISYSSICISLHPTGCGCSASPLRWEDDFLRAGKENMGAPFLPAIQERLLPTPLLACTGTCWSALRLLGPWWLVTSWSGCLLPDCRFCLWGTPCRSSPPYPQAPPSFPCPAGSGPSCPTCHQPFLTVVVFFFYCFCSLYLPTPDPWSLHTLVNILFGFRYIILFYCY